MALAVTHAFVTAKTDGSDASLLRPSNWNANHTITMDTNTLMGKASAGTGPAEAIPVSAATIAMLASADIPSILAYLGISPPTTGDLKPTLKAAADAGWIMVATVGAGNVTIGNVGSGATFASATALALYTLVWGLGNNTFSPVTGGRGATAAADWAALKPMMIGHFAARAFGVAGNPLELPTNRIAGDFLGAETATLIAANLPPYTPSGTVASTFTTSDSGVALGQTPIGVGSSGQSTFAAGSFHTITGAVSSAFNGSPQGGTSTPFSQYQPTFWANVMVKL
jgi:hypothetical protein